MKEILHTLPGLLGLYPESALAWIISTHRPAMKAVVGVIDLVVQRVTDSKGETMLLAKVYFRDVDARAAYKVSEARKLIGPDAVANGLVIESARDFGPELDLSGIPPEQQVTVIH